MSDIVADTEKTFMLLVCKNPVAFLESTNRGVVGRLFTNKDNLNLYKLLWKYHKLYKTLPTPESLYTYAQSASGISEEQKEKSTLYYQELLAEETPDIDITTCIDAMFTLYKRRAAVDLALTLSKEQSKDNIDKTIESLVADFTKLKNLGNKDEDIANYKSNNDERLAKYQAAKARKNSGGLLYCFDTLNKITGGQDPGTLWIIRGGPKAGKSTSLINMANHVVSTGKNIVYFSAEVSREVIERRLDALNTHIPMSAIKQGRLSPEQEEQYIKYLTTEDRKRGSFITIDNGSMNPEYIRGHVLDLLNKMPIHLIVVDYLSLLHMPYKFESNWLEIGEIAKALRAIAKELQIPVLTAVQTNVRSGKTALSQEIENTTDLLMDISREHPDEDVISGAAVQLQAKIVLSRDSGLGSFNVDANFAFSEMREVSLDYYGGSQGEDIYGEK